MKLLNLILHNDLAHKGLVCVDVNFISPTITQAEYSYIKVVKNKIEILESGVSELNNIIDIVSKINRPTIISYAGKGIICKKVDHSDEIEKIINIYTNGDVDRFIVSNNTIPDWGDFLIFADRQLVDETEKLFISKKIQILDIQYYPLNIIQFGSINTTEVIGRFLFDFQHKTFEKADQNPNISVETPKVNTSFFIATSYLSNLKSNSTFVKSIFFSNDLIYKFAIKNISLGLLVIFIIILLTNFLLYQNQFSINNQLIDAMSKKGLSMNNNDTLEKKIIENEDFLKNNLPKKTLFAYYIDEICSTIPSGIKLNTINAFPVNNETENDGNTTIVIDNNQFVFKGTATSSVVFDYWLKELNTIKWIEQSIIIDFSYNEVEKVGRFELEIKIRK